ncbi:MAG: VOC family protein [Gemmatimonadales bacterium]
MPVPHEAGAGATIVSLTLGGSQIELLEAADPASPIARFIARRGPGIHHVSVRVPDLDAALARCRAAGYRLVDEAPRPGAHGRRVAFIHPTATAGILVELTD